MNKTTRLIAILNTALIFIVGITYLLVNKIIEPGDFTLLMISIFIGSFVIVYFEKISEITIVGNTVKLQQINEKSEELLNKLRIEHLKLKIDSVFGLSNFFGGGDSVRSCRAKLFDAANDIKNFKLLDNEELKSSIMPLLTNHSNYQLELIRSFGRGLDSNPLEILVDPEEIREAISDEIVNKAQISGVSSNVDKMVIILEDIDIYKKLLKAKQWFDS